MDDPTPAAPQTPESTGLPADLFEKAQAAATEKGRPIYVYRTGRAGGHTSKWESVADATPAAVVEPFPKRDGQPPTAAAHDTTPGRAIPDTTITSATAANGPPEVPALAVREGERVTLYAAGGQTVEWARATGLLFEGGGACRQVPRRARQRRARGRGRRERQRCHARPFLRRATE